MLPWTTDSGLQYAGHQGIIDSMPAAARVAFKLAHESLKRMKPRAPKNFREAEVCDKIARRSAGLDSEEGPRQQLLININELMDGASADDQVIRLNP